MYHKEQVRPRFLEKIERLKTVMGSYAKVVVGCNLPSCNISDIWNPRVEMSLQVVMHFLTAYREHGVRVHTRWETGENSSAACSNCAGTES
ncbi:hypothetical protein SAMN05444128_3408 [Pontibacter indicus]|uniref:Uncharacterized protein n=1 Tax=Pontibacter indicus TaxID=1317125 RepID=A0A1R3XQ54_9BACT|nr:hypothetical protein SAMN05444128_3408 [Pontibacter indicus]